MGGTPLGGVAVVRRGLRLYRDNPILVVPPLVSMYVSFTFSAVFVGVGVVFLILVTRFFVMVGQMGMSERVVSVGRASLAEWAGSVMRYSHRVLGLYVFYWGIRGGIGILLVPLSLLFGPVVTMPIIFALVNTLMNSILYMLLALVAFDGIGFRGLIDLRFKTIWGKSWAFLGYLVFMFSVEFLTLFLRNIYVGTPIGSLYPLAMISEVISATVSPLLFLLAFIIIHPTHGSNRPHESTRSATQNRQPPKEATGGMKNFS